MRLLPIAVLACAAAAAATAYAQQQPRFEDLFSPRQTLPPPQPQQQPQRQPGIQQAPLPPPGQANPRGVPEIAAPPLPRQAQPQKGQPAPKGRGEVPVEPPAEARIVNPTAVFSGLDKITGRIFPFEAAINETVQFGALQVTPRACYSRPPTEPQNTTGFVEVDEITLDAKMRRIFTGWMFAASPGLHAVEHSIYDVWLVDCKQGPPDTSKSAG